tara:strand:+ start:441 stop:887 length:447 start_codon:yes stop_codon:yes gene_type:complete
MFTFGRQREKECAAYYLRNPDQLSLIEDVVDAVHDVIEDEHKIDDFRAAFERAFVDGGSGVWEKTASWLTKLSVEHEELLTEWRKLSTHPKAEVRFRVACCMNDMPAEVAAELADAFLTDHSRKVREMSAARIEEVLGEPGDARESPS